MRPDWTFPEREGTRYLAAEPDTRTVKTVAKQLHALTHPVNGTSVPPFPVASPPKEVQPTAMTTDTTKYFSLPSGDVIPVPTLEYQQGSGRRKYSKAFKRQARAFIRTAHNASANNREIGGLLGISSSMVSLWGSARLRAKHNAHARAITAAKRGETPTPKAAKVAKAHTNGAVQTNRESYSQTMAEMLTIVTAHVITATQVARAAQAAALLLDVN